MKKLLIVAAMLCAACASTPKQDVDDVPTPPPPGPSVDQRLTELQTSMTELLERMDVLSDRIARVEQGQESTGPVGGQAPPPVAPSVAPAGQARAPVPPQETPQTPAEPRPSRAIVGAQIADAYRNALMLYGKSRMGDARKAFQQVFDMDPSGELADNALYWIGETYFAAKDYPNALRYFRRVTSEYSDQNKAPDAMYKIAITLERQGDLQMAKQALDECIRKYPYSTQAASAKQELERIKF
jgi:tol-pal system protein YbgF